MSTPPPGRQGGQQGPRGPIPGQGPFQSVVNGFWNWINSQANKATGAFVGSVADFVKTVGTALMANNGSLAVLTKGLRRQAYWIVGRLQWVTDRLVWPLIQQDRRMIKHVRILALRYAAQVLTWSERYAKLAVSRERQARKLADQQLAAQVKRELAALHRIIEREAASAYRMGFPGRVSVIQRVADFIARDNPVVRPLVKDLVSGVLDLASVDDPVARIALGFLLRQVIDRLGLDKAAGELLDALLRPLLGEPRPHDLHGVIADLSARLAAVEGQWATFMADGGPEILQAGEEWQAIARPLGGIALLGLFGLMAAEPAAFARDTTNALAAIIDDTTRAASALIRGV